jgi:hypothetical protein
VPAPPPGTVPEPSGAAAPGVPDGGPVSVAMTQSAEGSSSFDAAVRCTAALQVATLAAPSWSREPGIADATNKWLADTFTQAEAAGIAGDRVSKIVEDEMQRQVSDAAGNPAALSRRAFDCAGSVPA